jgi:hypothetical protein
MREFNRRERFRDPDQTSRNGSGGMEHARLPSV